MDTATQCKNADAGFESWDSECPKVVDLNHHRNQLDLRLEGQQPEWCFKAPNWESAEDSLPSIMGDSNQWAVMGSFYEFGVTELESEGSSASEFVPVLANNSKFSGVCSDGGDFTFCDSVDSAGLYHSNDSLTLDQSLTDSFPTVAMSEASFNNFLEFKSRELLDDQKLPMLLRFRNRNLALQQQRFQPDNNSGQIFSKNCLKRRITEEENMDEPATTLTATAWQDACKSSRTVYDNNAARSNLRQKSKQGSSNDPQSIAARLRRERISERLKILQDLVPNGSKVGAFNFLSVVKATNSKTDCYPIKTCSNVDLVTMLEKAINYVKFLQLQIKVLATDEYWAKEEEQVMPRIMTIEDAMEAVAYAEANKKKQQQAGGHM